MLACFERHPDDASKNPFQLLLEMIKRDDISELCEIWDLDVSAMALSLSYKVCE